VKIVSTLFFVRFRERSHKIKYLYSDEFYGSLKSTFSNDVLHHKVVQLKKKTVCEIPHIYSQRVKLPWETGVFQYCHFHSATFISVSSTHMPNYMACVKSL